MRYLHTRYPPIGRAIAMQTMAAAAVKYVLPIRSSIRLVRARDATASLNFNTVTPFRDIQGLLSPTGLSTKAYLIYTTLA